MDAADRDAIAEAVRRAELQTAGEIVVVIDQAASSYRNVPVVMALALALFVPWPLLSLTAMSAQRIFMIQLFCAALLLGTLLWYGRGGRFVPGFVKRRRAHEAALREFTARMGEDFEVRISDQRSLTVSLRDLPRRPTILVLKGV